MKSTHRPSEQGQTFNKKRRMADLPIWGLIAGLLFPALAVIVLYFLWSGNASFEHYIRSFFSFTNPVMMNNASKVLSLGLLANLIPFYFFLNRKLYYAGRGVMVATFLYVILIVLYKFVWQ